MTRSRQHGVDPLQALQTTSVGEVMDLPSGETESAEIDFDDMAPPPEPGQLTQSEIMRCLLEKYSLADLQEALRECGGNPAAASNWLRVMGMNQSGLHRNFTKVS